MLVESENMNSRKIVLDILNEVDKGKYVNQLIAEMQKLDIPAVDKNFISKIVYGVVENRIYLDYMIRKFSSIRLKKIDDQILNVLRLSAYQMIYLTKVPHSAVVNEGVKLVKKINHRHTGFTNGILRNMSRDYQSVELPSVSKEPIKYLSVKYSHPEWLVERFMNNYGFDFTEDLLASNNETPNLVLRTNSILINREDLMTKLVNVGFECEKSDIVEEGIVIRRTNDLTLEENTLFRDGYFTVQDESSMMIAGIVEPAQGDLVLDMCSAPGGKTTHMAALMNNEGEIVACDISQRKLDLIEENIKRLHLKNIRTMINDATVFNPSFVDKFDKVLVDAPCSGLGIIRRKPDIKYLKSIEDIKALVEIQRAILENASKYVKPGGMLIYSTCTVEKLENEEQIKGFLKTHNEFRIVPIDDEESLQLFPNINETDGFFCCKLTKIGD